MRIEDRDLEVLVVVVFDMSSSNGSHVCYDGIFWHVRPCQVNEGVKGCFTGRQPKESANCLVVLRMR